MDIGMKSNWKIILIALISIGIFSTADAEARSSKRARCRMVPYRGWFCDCPDEDYPYLRYDGRCYEDSLLDTDSSIKPASDVNEEMPPNSTSGT